MKTTAFGNRGVHFRILTLKDETNFRLMDSEKTVFSLKSRKLAIPLISVPQIVFKLQKYDLEVYDLFVAMYVLHRLLDGHALRNRFQSKTMSVG